ncbi:sulfite exporter TauE/SafE family protein [Mycobacteroides abscessus subsp. massiliense]|uniref:sulfite exporter TauE/SafE family protein n=1 Tax=Mycobacteroides abscessus TaxID=36809 RepID=UPI000F6245BC|nr:sulfite exporter TauE/SafE family protein [Mycobacteroides abscessus]RRE01433.1 sulfite exporter TauE/SafE family protein [Mycobacteroides abscessus subsp. massiliense]
MLVLVLIGILAGLTTVLFGFGGGFVTVPVIVWADGALGAAAPAVAVATSAVVMVVNAAAATAATSRATLAHLRSAVPLVALLACGGALGAGLARLAPPQLTTWGFVGYLVITIADVLLRPGFLRRPAVIDGPRRAFAIPAGLGIPIGATASFLGVGGSVMTVPLLRRGGQPMSVATALANPLTLAISVPALAVFLTSTAAAVAGEPYFAGAVDCRAAAALLAGALPLVMWLRRRPPRLPDTVHAWAYVGLLVVSAVAMLTAGAP